jgi:hypothetical protein
MLVGTDTSVHMHCHIQLDTALHKTLPLVFDLVVHPCHFLWVRVT